MSVKQLLDLSGKVAFITGGSRGLGLQMAEALGELGAKIAISARKQHELDAAKEHLESQGVTVVTIAADLGDLEGIPKVVDQVVEQLGDIDILVNNAGATWGAPLDDFPVAAFEKVMNLNVNSVFELTRQCLPLLRKGASAPDPSRVVITSSVEGLSTSRQANFPYSASKAGVIHLAKHLAKTVAPENITVNCLAPGPFESKMMAFALDNPDMRSAIAGSIPLQRIGEPEDVAGAVIYLCSRAGAYVTGQTLAVDGGLVLGPA